MKKLFLPFLLIAITLNAELDLGDDFAPGDAISAEEFNLKFKKLNQAVGEISDSYMLGKWNCTSYKPSYWDGDKYSVEYPYEIADGGNGQVGNGYYYSNSGIFTLTETDTESSLNSPKNWSISRDDVIEDSGVESGTYTLLANKLILFFSQKSPSDEVINYWGGTFKIIILGENRISFERIEYMGLALNKNIICDKAS